MAQLHRKLQKYIEKKHKVEGLNNIRLVFYDKKKRRPYDRPDFSNARDLVRQYPNDEIAIETLMIRSIQQKIRGIGMISQYLFSRNGYDTISQYSKKITDDYESLKIVERNQARAFWKYAGIYANRMGIPFRNRITHKRKIDRIDILNYRMNLVGSTLRTECLIYLGKGDGIDLSIVPVHISMPSLDIVEMARPMLYYLVLKTLSTSEDRLKELAREIVRNYMDHFLLSIQKLSTDNRLPRKLAYKQYLDELSEKIRNEGIFRGKVFVGQLVTRYVQEGVIEYYKQNKVQKLGEKIHNKLLCEFAHPLRIPAEKYDYEQVMAEVPVNSASGNVKGRIDLIHMGVDNKLRMICDIKTYSKKLPIEMGDVNQVNQYCELLEENGFDLTDVHRFVVYISQKEPIDSIRPILDWFMTNPSIDREYKQIKSGIVDILHWR